MFQSKHFDIQMKVPFFFKESVPPHERNSGPGVVECISVLFNFRYLYENILVKVKDISFML